MVNWSTNKCIQPPSGVAAFYRIIGRGEPFACKSLLSLLLFGLVVGLKPAMIAAFVGRQTPVGRPSLRKCVC
ncbi:hypothetical protein TOL_1895 [Thalassolituus oleivorans MIL-1]|uniref:Uncharacterized protein n=1 Tax=Thalassolituus oleivorans MIL-1 TaxID=1298593 RepID=M5DS90_9GAMM|nr:hypothetical protein TOL_1895 [Thalassolituus oleivorans MIL-1]